LRGIIVLDENFRIVTDESLLSDIFLTYLVLFPLRYGQFEPPSLKRLTEGHYLGQFDSLFFEQASPPITEPDIKFIKNLNENLLAKIIFAPQEIGEYFSEMLKGGLAKQRYLNILKEMLLKKKSDFSSTEKKRVFDLFFQGKSIVDDFLKAGQLSKSEQIRKISKVLKKLMGEFVTVKDPLGNKIVEIRGQKVTIFWTEPLIDLVFAVAEERAYLEERIEQLKIILELANNYPGSGFNSQLIRAMKEVINESEFSPLEELNQKLVDFFLNEVSKFGLRWTRKFLVDKWASFILQNTARDSLLQYLLAGAASQVSLGFSISNVLWGMDALYDSGVKAATTLDFSARLIQLLSKLCQQNRQDNYYEALKARQLRALLVWAGLCRMEFHDCMARNANSSLIKRWVVDLFASFFGQKTMSEVIQERQSWAEDAERLIEATYLNNQKIAELVQLADLRARKRGVITEGTALALIVDSTGSMEQNDPENVRIYGGELVLDQAEDDWEIGIIDFDSTAVLLASGLPGDRKLREALKNIDSDGSTNIQAGLETGFNFLKLSSEKKKGAILLTDGEHNTPSAEFDYSTYVDIFTQAGWPVYTIGLTGEANEILLSKIADMTGGVYYKADNYHEMLGIIDLILTEFKLEMLVFHNQDNVRQGETKVFTFPIDKSIQKINATQTYMGSQVDFNLIDPQGRKIDSTDISRGIEVIEGDLYKIIKVKNPLPGPWKAQVIGVDVEGEEPFEIKVSAETPIQIELKEVKPVYLPYEPIVFNVDIGGDIDRPSLAWEIEVITPEGKTEKVALRKNSTVTYRKTAKPGVYYFNIKVNGKTAEGEAFSRQKIKHIVVSSSGREFGVGEVIREWGGYVEINLGREIGLKPGWKIFIYDVSSGMKKLIATGLVISVDRGTSIVELDAGYGSGVPRQGNRAEMERKEVK